MIDNNADWTVDWTGQQGDSLKSTTQLAETNATEGSLTEYAPLFEPQVQIQSPAPTGSAVTIPYSPAKPTWWTLVLLGGVPPIGLALALYSGQPDLCTVSTTTVVLLCWFFVVNAIYPMFHPITLWFRKHWLLSFVCVSALLFWHAPAYTLVFAIAVFWWPAWITIQCRSYFDHKIVLNEEGFHFPFKTMVCPYFNGLLPWNKAISIDCHVTPGRNTGEFDPDVDPFKNYSLTMKTSSDTRSIDLKHLSVQERLRLFAAINAWAKPLTISKQLRVLLQNAPVQSAKGQDFPSFTSLWQEDFKTQLNATVYVPLDIGQKISQYTINKHLASGGQATTYLATDASSETVVLKEYVLPHETEANAREQVRASFNREYQLLKQCDHPRVAKVLDQFTENDRNYLVLQHIPGENARKRIQLFGVMSSDDVIKIAQELIEILEYLHSRTPPILHRDLSPDNMIIDEHNSVFLIDFGAANELISNATGTAIGKQAYVAPEQFKGKACIPSDIYSLGCCLHFLLTAKDPLPLMASHPRLLNPLVPLELDELIARTTAQDLLGRIPRISKLGEDLALVSAALSKPINRTN